ncbi:MAG: metallophosphoesterase [Chloroflexales bacterium]|nr:metallophosphoesterase [Chloroflexales bacterium]
MRLVYTADLHGYLAGYQRLCELAVQYTAQAAIVGGDLLPHGISINAAIQTQCDFIEQALKPLLEQFRAVHPEIAVYLLPGNDDWAAAIETLATLEEAGLIHLLHERVFALTENLWLAGYACVPITPFSIKDYERHDEGDTPAYSFAMAYTSAGGRPVKTSLDAILRLPSIGEGLAALAQQSDPARTIYVCHTPPYSTSLDAMLNKHVGSRALRTFIAQRQPLLTLHGHIHEAPHISGRFAERLGTTWCVNPGHERTRFSAVTIDTDNIADTLCHTLYGYLTD